MWGFNTNQYKNDAKPFEFPNLWNYHHIKSDEIHFVIV